MSTTPTFDPAGIQETARLPKRQMEAEVFRSQKLLVDKARHEIGALPERIGLDDAVGLTRALELRGAVHQNAVWLNRFVWGVVARRMTEAAQRGDSPMDRLAEATHIHVNTVRECRALAKFYDDNVVLFGRWLRSIMHKKGKPARWYEVQELIGSNEDPSILGPEALADRVIANIERAAHQVDQANGDDRAEGAATLLHQSVTGFNERGLRKLNERDEVEVFEKNTPRDPDFLEMVRHMNCAATGEPPPPEGWEGTWIAVDPHHLGSGGKGLKGSDYTCIPLSRTAHDFFHDHGPRAFHEEYNVDVRTVMFQTLHMYMTGGRKADLPSFAQ